MTATAPAPTYAPVPIGELCEFLNGGTPSKANVDFWNGDIPWITSAEINGGEVAAPRFKITRDAIDESSTRLVPAGTLLLVIRTGVGKVGIAPYDLTFNQDINAVHPDPTRLDKQYLRRFLESQGDHFEKFSRGATVKGITREHLGRLAIPMPFPDDARRSLAEQKRIAAILDMADAIRRRRQEAARLADTLIPSVFYELFGDPIMNRKRFPSSTIGEVAAVQGGLALSQARNGLELEVAYLRVANVLRDRLDLTEIKTLGVTQAELEKTRLCKGDVLIVEGHGNREEVGRSAIWDGSIPGCVHQNHLIRVRVNAKQITPEFLNAYINSDAGRRQLFRHGKTTSGLNTISISNVRGVQTLLPPLPLQERFSTAVRAIRDATVERSRVSSMLNDFFNSLVQRAFRGEL